ncbi:MAG: glutamate racemase [Anaerolineales bacterium]|nr:glutamate racemase [Anaerolineales bacterium]
MPPDPGSPVGVFDSGVGGLSVLRHLWSELPHEEVIFFADQAHVPYGPRPLEQVRQFSVEITRWLLARGAKLIVVACNTASAAALHHLRQVFPETPFVGMEPAVKPAAESTRSGRVGVLATPATFQGELYASVVERFAAGVQLMTHTCPGLVAQIEAGQLDTPKTRRILEEALQPMLAAGIDTVVLGCTHYPFVIPLIEEIAGPGVRVIDPAPAIARQARRLLVERGWLSSARESRPPHPCTRFLTTGDPRKLEAQLPKLLGISASVDQINFSEPPGPA